MNGSGCKTCPVNPCNTVYYRGSYCSGQRAKFGLGDPQTNADRFRAMSDDEQQKCVRRFFEVEDFADWLQQPAGEE